MNCGSNQVDHLWFLAGTLGGGKVAAEDVQDPERDVPVLPARETRQRRQLALPERSAVTSALEAYVRSQTVCIVGTELHAEIDGVPVKNPQQYLEQSPLFIVHFPTDNIYGITPDIAPGLILDPTVDRGYYLLLEPLAPGKHTIHFSTAAGTASCGPTQDVTYTLTVAK